MVYTQESRLHDKLVGPSESAAHGCIRGFSALAVTLTGVQVKTVVLPAVVLMQDKDFVALPAS